MVRNPPFGRITVRNVDGVRRISLARSHARRDGGMQVTASRQYRGHFDAYGTMKRDRYGARRRRLIRIALGGSHIVVRATHSRQSLLVCTV
jgi:hypothetical protein